MLFNFDSYKKLLTEIKDVYHYTFHRFDKKVSRNEKKIIYLRHDVDISPYSAIQLGKIEQSLNIQANYFFQIGTETYNVFNIDNIKIIKDLISFGHCVGLHIDELIFGYNENKILSTLKWFKECIADVSFVVSFHRPTKSTLYKKYESFVNVYQEALFSSDHFLSDSRKNVEFYPKLLNWLKENKTPIQLLLHPAWWYPTQDIIKFKDELVKRRISELETYLKKNFKNIKEHIKNEDRTFGL